MSSRRKGRRAELEFAKRYGGRRINDEGLPGPDVAIYPHPYTDMGETLWEIKRQERIAVMNWYRQAIEEGADYLAYRENRGEWMITHPIEQPCPCPLNPTDQ